MLVKTYNIHKSEAFTSPFKPTSPQDLSATIYKTNFEKLNKALEKGELSTASNALEAIHK